MATRDHLYTIDEQERDDAQTLFGFTLDKVECFVFPPGGTSALPKFRGAPGPGTVPLFRLIGSPKGFANHFMTHSVEELNASIVNDHYKLDQLVCFLFPQERKDIPGTVPLARFRHPDTVDRFYASNIEEIAGAPGFGYIGEGTAAHVFPTDKPQPTGTVPLYRLSKN